MKKAMLRGEAKTGAMAPFLAFLCFQVNIWSLGTGPQKLMFKRICISTNIFELKPQPIDNSGGIYCAPAPVAFVIYILRMHLLSVRGLAPMALFVLSAAAAGTGVVAAYLGVAADYGSPVGAGGAAHGRSFSA